MITSTTTLDLIELSRLYPAPWNYKQDAFTTEDKQRFVQSILRDASCGVLAVRIREEDETTFEVIDGNHRLAAIKELGWTHAPVENFGTLPLADAILLAKRRNTQWFADDLVKLSELYTNVVLPTYNMDELVSFMPDSREVLLSVANLVQNSFITADSNTVSSSVTATTLSIKVGASVYEDWLTFCSWMSIKYALSTHDDILSFVIKTIRDMHVEE